MTASEDNTARIWDVGSGAQIVLLKGHAGRVSSAVFGPDGTRVVTASDDKTARIWDADSGNEIALLNGHSRGVSSAVFSPDGKRVVTASADNVAGPWDSNTGAEITLLKGHTDLVFSAGFSADGKRMVTTSDDNTARIWDVTQAMLVRGEALRDSVCIEIVVGSAQEFTDVELEDPILRGIDKNDPIARNPCLRRGPLSLDYWTRLPMQFWHLLHANVVANRS